MPAPPPAIQQRPQFLRTALQLSAGTLGATATQLGWVSKKDRTGQKKKYPAEASSKLIGPIREVCYIEEHPRFLCG